MNPAEGSPRKLVYALLITLAAGTAAGRIASAERVYEPSLARDEADPADRRSKWPATRPRPMPTFSSNDRSRWATVRALVDEGTFVVGRRDPAGGDCGIAFEDGWQTVDKVLHPVKLEYYSTKPPLLSTVVAGLYWLLQTLFGWTLSADPFPVVRTTLVVVNLLPFVAYLWLLMRLAERHARTDWARCYVVAAAGFATLVTPFLITFNNHTVATFCVVFALVPVFPLLEPPWHRPAVSSLPTPAAFAASGFCAGLVVCNELPALAFAALLLAVLLLHAPWRTLAFFTPALIVPLAAQLGLNYLAIGEWDFAYSKFGGPWYEYPGSHWQKPPPGQLKYGIDWAWMHESRWTYALNILLGHHGLFSLTPLWVL